MSIAALLLVLAAALLHASWNLVVKSSNDRLIAAGIQFTVAALVCAPFLFFVDVPAKAFPYLIATSIAHLGYVLSLVAAYDRADLSVVYPIARGAAPVFVTIGAALFLDDTPGGWGLAAIGLVVAGVLIVGIRGTGHGVGWALATAVFISGYTMIDGGAVRELDASLPYTLAAFVAFAAPLIPVVLLRRRPAEISAAVRSEGWGHVFGALAGLVAYALVLAAARVAPLGLVSAFRETSVVFGALGGWLLLKEELGRRRIRGAVLIAAGVVALLAAG